MVAEIVSWVVMAWSVYDGHVVWLRSQNPAFNAC